MPGAQLNPCRAFCSLEMDHQAHLPVLAAGGCLPSRYRLDFPEPELPCPCLLQGGARLAEGLCRALGISKAVLVGHSAGALTAMEVFKRCKAVLSKQMRESCRASGPRTERPCMMFRGIDLWVSWQMRDTCCASWQREARHAVPQVSCPEHPRGCQSAASGRAWLPQQCPVCSSASTWLGHFRSQAHSASLPIVANLQGQQLRACTAADRRCECSAAQGRF